MRFKSLFVLTILFLTGCKQEKDGAISLLDYLPQNTSVIIKINNLSGLKSEFKNNDFLHNLNNSETYNVILEHITVLDYIQTGTMGILAFAAFENGTSEFIFVAPNHPELFDLERVVNTSSEPITYRNQNFNKYTVEETTFYSTVIKNHLVLCSSELLLKNLISEIRDRKVDPVLRSLYATANHNKSASIFINSKKSDVIVKSVLNEESEATLSNSSDWISFDLNIGQDYINLNGLSLAQDSTKSFINLFKNTHPLVSTIPQIAPSISNAILSFSISDYEVFAKNQQQYLAKNTAMDTIFSAVEEIGHIYMNGKKAIVLSTYGSEDVSQFLQGLEKNSFDYQGNEIIALKKNDFLNTFFEPIIKDFNANFYTVMENAFVFSTERIALRNIISSYNSGATYNTSTIFKTIKGALADESNVLFISDSKGMEALLTSDFSAQFLSDFKSSSPSKFAFGAQIVAEANFYHTNLVIQKIGTTIKNNTTSQLFSVQLDGELATNPQFVINHRTNKKEIVVQDQDNNLYLISTEGKVLWKKPLKGRIQGRIMQVDIYKNGRLQLAFTTDNQFLILDRNGKEVRPFNISFPESNLNPLAVFDYEGTKNYRFVVTQGSKIFMYNSKGNIVKGFKYTKAESPVLSAPKHFRIGKKDYLVFKLENGDLKIMNRVGNVRVNIREKIDFSENDIFRYKNRFAGTDKDGTLFVIDEKGNVAKTKFNLNEDHGFYATSKTLTTMNDNILTIKGKKVSLDLGVYTKPKIFYLYDKIYVSVTDIQSQKVYLFDSNAEPVKHFPVFGTSQIDLEDIDNDRKLELVAKDQDSSLVVYKMN